MKLTAHQLSLLLDEIAQMAKSERPFTLGLAELNHRSLGRIGLAANMLAKQIAAGQSIETAMASISGKFGPQAAAALHSMQLTGSAKPVLQLADTLRRQSYMHIQWIVSVIYPLITALAAYILLSTVLTSFVLEHWPSEIIGKRNSVTFIQFCSWLKQHFWWPPAIVAGCCLVVLVTRRLGWFGWSFFYRSANDVAWSNFCNLLAIQVNANVPLAEALPLAADAAGSSYVRRQIQLMHQGVGTPAGLTPPLIRWLLGHASGYSSGDLAQQLRQMGTWYEYQAMKRSRLWIKYVPIVMTILAGGCAALIYCFLLLPPLYEGLIQVAQ